MAINTVDQKEIRIIARLDVKPPHVIKGVHFEGLRIMGTPEELAFDYYNQGADEIFYVDAVASLYRRPIIYPHIEGTAQRIFVPFCVGGGITKIEDMAQLLHHGADKIVLNTAAISNPILIREAAKIFGRQCVVVSIEAKRWDTWWECYTDYGRIRSGKNAVDWAKEAEALGAGEILVTSVDTEGRRRGFDIALTKAISESVSVPVIASGGAGELSHIKDVILKANVDAVAIATLLHYKDLTINQIKTYLRNEGIRVNA